MPAVLVLILYFVLVTAAAAAVLIEYRRWDIGRFIKANLRAELQSRPEATAPVQPQALRADHGSE
jgi:hypothetical protein